MAAETSRGGFWASFFRRLLSIETARFILALLALNYCAAAVIMLMTGFADIDESKESVVTFALGNLNALATMAFAKYFQQRSRTDDPIPGADYQRPERPVQPDPCPNRPLPTPEFGDSP